MRKISKNLGVSENKGVKRKDGDRSQSLRKDTRWVLSEHVRTGQSFTNTKG